MNAKVGDIVTVTGLGGWIEEDDEFKVIKVDPGDGFDFIIDLEDDSVEQQAAKKLGFGNGYAAIRKENVAGVVEHED